MEKDLISIIIPIYNGEKYIKRCINCLQKQTYQNIEFILVNDGSTDSSQDILEEYKDIPNIKIIVQENKGIAGARNTGLAASNGKYIAFVDVDDLIPSYYIEEMYKVINNTQADIAIADTINIDNQSDFEKIKDTFKEETPGSKTGEEACRLLIRDEQLTVAHSKLYTKDILNTFKVPEGGIYEDIRSTYMYFLNAKKIAFAPNIKYFYILNKEGVTSSIPKDEFSIDKINALIERIQTLKKLEKYEIAELFDKELLKYYFFEKKNKQNKECDGIMNRYISKRNFFSKSLKNFFK